MTQNTQPPPPNITALKDALAETLLIPGQDPALLARQAELLDRLFALSLEKATQNMAADKASMGAYAAQWLDFGLRVQKQCTDTVKARAAVSYMQHLSTAQPLAHLPHPHKIENELSNSKKQAKTNG